MSAPIVFISYSWDTPEHRDWVLSIADGLVKNGVDVLLDQYDLAAGKEMTFFMEKAMSADKIILIMTPGYKDKADRRSGGVGYEYSLFTKELYEQEADKSRIIPVLRSGSKEVSCPTFIQTRIFHDMRDDKAFDPKFFELIKLIVGRPLVAKPALGKLPDFDREIPDAEKAIRDYQQKATSHAKKESFLFSYDGVNLFKNTAEAIVEQIAGTLENYRTNFNVGFHIKRNQYNSEILFSTVNYTYFVGIEGLAQNTATEAHIVTNFFKGPVGLGGGIDYDGRIENIYKHRYKFEVDDNLTPIFVRSDNKNIKLSGHDIATVAVREVVVNEMKLRESEIK